jgi:hypothetical protein
MIRPSWVSPWYFLFATPTDLEVQQLGAYSVQVLAASPEWLGAREKGQELT